MPEEVRSILATDCGSTTTKAILIEKREAEYRLAVRGEAPTTVEAPFDDVTVGVRNAVREVEELVGGKYLGELAEMILSADPRPRLGIGLKIPVIYAGNQEAIPPVEEILSTRVDLHPVANLRPTLDRENLGPAREAIHELFLQHVMQQAPG